MKKYLPILYAQTLQKLEFEENDSFMEIINDFYESLLIRLKEIQENWILEDSKNN